MNASVRDVVRFATYRLNYQNGPNPMPNVNGAGA